MFLDLLYSRLRLGKFAGIGLYLHWSFAVLVAYVALSSRAGGPQAVLMSLAQLGGMFLCVTLHEYGHAMAARMYGIGTADITLLPIGGVARLLRMPRIPIREWVVAVAGPAVNVVLLCILIPTLCWLDWNTIQGLINMYRMGLAAGDGQALISVGESTLSVFGSVIGESSPAGFLWLMAAVNAALVLFNMIPAFPMDGGRVLRSTLAMLMDYGRATWWASRIGLIIAMVMMGVALTSQPIGVVPLGVAIFVAVAGIAESKQVQLVESVRGWKVRDVMIPCNESVSINDSPQQVAQRWAQTPHRVLPVVHPDGTVAGALDLARFCKKMKRVAGPSSTAGYLVDHADGPGTVDVDAGLENLIPSLDNGGPPIVVIDQDSNLCGLLDPRQIRHRFRLNQFISGDSTTAEADE